MLGLKIKKYILKINLISKKWNRAKFLSLIIYLLEKVNTLNLIRDTLKINKVLIWSKIKTKFIDQFIRFKILNSKKMISDFVNKKIIKYKDKIIINIRNHKKLLIKALWNFNI